MPLPNLPPEVLADMALRNPEMAARYAAQTGQTPPQIPMMKPAMLGPAPAPVPAMRPNMSAGAALASPPTPAMRPDMTAPSGPAPMPAPPKPEVPASDAQSAVDPNAIGALLAGVQGTQPQGQGQAPATAIQGYSGPSGGDILQLLLRNPQLAAGLTQYLPGQRF